MSQLEGGRSSPALPPGLDAPKNRFKSAARANRLADESKDLEGVIGDDDHETGHAGMGFHSGGRDISSTPLDAETEAAFELVAQRDGERVATLRSKHASALKETQEAEKSLLSVKTAVEDAEAIYNNVRADIASGHGDGNGHHPDDDGDDWDKYLHFGEGGHGEDESGVATPKKESDPEAAAAAAAAAEAAAAMKEGVDGSPGVQSPEAAAAVRVTGSGVGTNDGDDEAVATEQAPETPRYQPSLQEAEQYLLSELKKLEAANAWLMTARNVLTDIERQLNDATARAEENAQSARRRREAASGGAGNVGCAKSDNADFDADEHRRQGSPTGPSGAASGAGNGAASTAARRASTAAGGGGKVIEDRRFGIYDSRRYRMEGEPAPPDPSDDDELAGRSTSVRGRGASANAGKKDEGGRKKNGLVKGGNTGGKKSKGAGVSVDAALRQVASRGGRGGRGDGGRGSHSGGGGGRTGSTGRKITPASASQLRAAGRDESKHAGFQFKKGDKGGKFTAPSASDAATYVAKGGGLRWRMKRPRTRATVGRPATGPTSWAAISSFALWRGNELELAKKRTKDNAAGDESEEDDEDEYHAREYDDDDDDDELDDSDGGEFDREAFEKARADAQSPGFGLGDGWVEDDIIFDHFDHFDELTEGDDGVVDIGAVMDLGFDEGGSEL